MSVALKPTPNQTVEGPVIVIVAVGFAPAETATDSLTSDCWAPAVSVAPQQASEALVLKYTCAEPPSFEGVTTISIVCQLDVS